MEGIARKLLRQMQESWGLRRGKELVVPDPLVEYLGRESHRRNEKAQGREGGRIVRRLMAELIEAPIQRAATAHPDAYRNCQRVMLESSFPELADAGSPPAPSVWVSFQRADDPAGHEEDAGHGG